MADFYMYIGLPGSGKSTIAAAQKGATIISSDAIRGELYGDENILGKHNEVFGLMLRPLERLLQKEKRCVMMRLISQVDVAEACWNSFQKVRRNTQSLCGLDTALV